MASDWRLSPGLLPAQSLQSRWRGVKEVGQVRQSFQAPNSRPQPAGLSSLATNPRPIPFFLSPLPITSFGMATSHFFRAIFYVFSAPFLRQLEINKSKYIVINRGGWLLINSRKKFILLLSDFTVCFIYVHISYIWYLIYNTYNIYVLTYII